MSDDGTFAIDPSQMTVLGGGGIDPSQMRTSPSAIDPSKLKISHAPAPSPNKGVIDPAQFQVGTNTGLGKSKNWLYSVGPNDVMGDFRTDWRGFNKGGIKPEFRGFLGRLGDAGFSMGIYDLQKGHHYAPNDPHLEGRAADVDTINGESVGTKLTPKIGQFIATALSMNPDAWVGVPKQIYDQLPAALKTRAFVDAPAHVHVQLSREGVNFYGGADHSPVSHMSAGQLEHVQSGGVQLPYNHQAVQHWIHQQATAEAKLRTALGVIGRVPIKGVLDVLGAPQRAVGEAVGGLEAGHNIAQVFGDAWHGLIDAETSKHATDSVRAALSFSHGVIPGGMSRQDINNMVNNANVPKMLKPYLAGLMNTGEDFTAQTMSDPLTYVGGLGIWAKGVKGAMMGMGQAARALAAVDEFSQAARAGKAAGPWADLFRHVPGIWWKAGVAMHRTADKVADGLADSFKQRPDLEDFSKGTGGPRGTARQQGGFTEAGKQRRMSVEASEVHARNEATAADQQALRHPTKPFQALAARYLKLIYEHGTQADSDVAARMLGAQRAKSTGYLAGSKGLGDPSTTVRDILDIAKAPDDQQETLAQQTLASLLKGRNKVREFRTADRTHEFTATGPDRAENLKPGTTPQSAEDWRGVAMDPARARASGIGQTKLFQWMRELQRSNVMIFPFPHGLVNVGQLAYLGAPEREGMRVVMDAFRVMGGKLKSDLPGVIDSTADEAELAKYGGAQTYVHEHEAPGMWANWPTVFGGDLMKGHIIRMQTALGHMETGWRVALWRALKRNPETAKLDPLMRGAMVAQRAGDPRNVSAFVRTFEQFGGPFVAYRLGIVPPAVLRAVAQNPQRVLAAIRPVLDLQENRSKSAQAHNTLMFNDPVSNAARLFGPSFLSYMLSPATIGALGVAERYQSDVGEHNEPWEQAVWETAQNFDPYAMLFEILNTAVVPHTAGASANPMPGQKMSMADHIIMSTLMPLASFYFAKNQKASYAHQSEHRTRKAIEKFLKDTIEAPFEGKGQ